jgi:erythromycin esterase-like protein
MAMDHLHVNHEDVLSDPEIALPARLLQQLAAEGIVGSATDENLSVMGYQDRSLESWRHETLPDLVAWLRDRQADGVILAPA